MEKKGFVGWGREGEKVSWGDHGQERGRPFVSLQAQLAQEMDIMGRSKLVERKVEEHRESQLQPCVP